MNGMRTRAFVAILLPFIFLLGGCELYGWLVNDDGSNEPERPLLDLEVHLNIDFDADHVRVEIDGEKVFEGRATTNYVLSLAEVIRIQEPYGRHKIEVVVNEEYRAERRFYLDRPLYVLVRYSSESLPEVHLPEGVEIEVTDQRPLYD